MIASIVQDIRYALRQLRKSPGFALTAVAVLALGLGADKAVFTLIDGILLRPLPYAQAGRLVAVNTSSQNGFNSLHDALTFGSVIAVLASVSLMAAWIPACNAAQIEPGKTLRSK